MKTYNFNLPVKVKLTARGQWIYKGWVNENGYNYDVPAPVDKNGYSEFTMVKLIEIFSDGINNAPHKYTFGQKLPFSMEVILPESSISNLPTIKPDEEKREEKPLSTRDLAFRQWHNAPESDITKEDYER